MLLAGHLAQAGATALAPALACGLLPRMRLAAQAGAAALGSLLSQPSPLQQQQQQPWPLAGNTCSQLQRTRGMLWSVEREKDHTYKDPDTIINDAQIHAAMENTQAAAKDKGAIQAILDAAKDRSFLTNYTPGL